MTQPELPAELSQPDFLQGVRQFKADLAQAYEVWRRQLDSLSFEEALQQLRLMSAGCTTPRPLEQWHDLDANSTGLVPNMRLNAFPYILKTTASRMAPSFLRWVHFYKFQFISMRFNCYHP